MKFTFKLGSKKLKGFKKKLNDAPKAVRRDDAREMGKGVIKLMKALISTGKSPIESRGSFPAYRGGYKAQIKNKGYVYSGGQKYSKSLSPVNLKVSGRFLSKIVSSTERGKYGFGVTVGFNQDYGKDLEKYHRRGANGQAKRPIIPNSRELFTPKIMNYYKREVIKSMNRVIKRKVS